MTAPCGTITREATMPVRIVDIVEDSSRLTGLVDLTTYRKAFENT